ncbi:MAG: toll/interleukin-1 receptor domain-containing protein [Desulfobacteraceae bacterium]|nr:toll/interleukin-1 receptor domain-containing protein [Desulfobacteraceae bacterium]
MLKQLDNLMALRLGGRNLYTIQAISDSCPDPSEFPKQTAVFMPVLSQNYLRSPDCQNALNAFLKNGNDCKRVFLLEYAAVSRPESLQKAWTYRFYKPGDRSLTAQDLQYQYQLDMLANELAEKLRQLRQEAEFKQKIAALRASEKKPFIFLCHAKEDSKHVRMLYDRLKQVGFNPWMDEISILPGQEWDYEVRQAMKHTDFVLIFLSEISVRKRGYLNKEIKWAIDRQDQMLRGDIFAIPVKLEQCELPDDLSDWQAVELFASDGFEKLFKALEYQLLKRKQEAEKLRKSDKAFSSLTDFPPALLFVNSAPEDRPLSEQIRQFLDNYNIPYSLPLDISYNPSPADIRQDLDNNLLACDLLIVIYGTASPVWVRGELLRCRKIQPKRETPLKIMLVHNDVSVGSKPPLNLKFDNLRIYDCPPSHIGQYLNECKDCVLE